MFRSLPKIDGARRSGPRCLRPARAPRTLAGLLALLVMSLPAAAQEGGDLEAQILYAWHVADLRRLHELHDNLIATEQAGQAGATVRYHLAHTDYRLALLRREEDPHAAGNALGECIDQLAPLIDSGSPSSDTLALQAICYVESASLRRLQAAVLRARARERLDRAVGLDPANPRVRLAQALLRLRTAPPGAPTPAELAQAADLFEREPATREDAPGWGHADAFLLLGRELRVHGDELGARNWIEKALIAAPDFRAAQAELALLRR
ncbi:MAG: hypothetical protein U1F35_01585 [Steroidobacteraceae bacterium]